MIPRLPLQLQPPPSLLFPRIRYVTNLNHLDLGQRAQASCVQRMLLRLCCHFASCSCARIWLLPMAAYLASVKDAPYKRFTQEGFDTWCDNALHVSADELEETSAHLLSLMSADASSVTLTLPCSSTSTKKCRGKPFVLLAASSLLFSTTLYNTRISKPVKKVGHPDCVSEPVKQCENIPNSNKRNVARTVCDTVVDTHEVEDCTETITEVCEQTNTYSHTTGKRLGVSVL